MKGNTLEARVARNRHKYHYWRDHDRETYTCPECGRGEGEVKQFDVHHKDGNPMNGDEENLVALCRRCHNREHGRTKQTETLGEWKDRVNNLGD